MAMDTDIIILIILSILSFTLTSILLTTIYLHRNGPRRIPRHPVVSALLWLTLPRIVLLLIPFLMRSQLQTGLPFHQRQRQGWQQRTSLGKWCAAQALLVNYLLITNAAFTSSFTLSLLYIISRPYLSSRSHSRRRTFLPFKLKFLSKPNISLFLSIAPLLIALPIPFLGLGLILSINPEKRQIVYFQGTYCNLDVYPFELACGILAGVPLVVSLVPLLFVVKRVYDIRWAVRQSQSQSVEGKDALNTIITSTTHNDPEENTMEADNEVDPASPNNNALHLRLATRLVLLAFEITISGVLFLLQVSLSGEQLTTALTIDKYWEAIAPLIQFTIFASQTAVLEVWFPGWFGTPPTPRSPVSPVSPLTRMGGAEKAPRVSLGTESLSLSLSEEIMEVGNEGITEIREVRNATEVEGIEEMGIDGMETLSDEETRLGETKSSQTRRNIFSSVFDSDVGHIGRLESEVDVSDLGDGLEAEAEEAWLQRRREGDRYLYESAQNSEQEESESGSGGEEEEEEEPPSPKSTASRTHMDTRMPTDAHGALGLTRDPTLHLHPTPPSPSHSSHSPPRIHTNSSHPSALHLSPPQTRTTSTSTSNSTANTQTSNWTRTRRRPRRDVAIPTFLKKGPGRLPER